MNKTHTNWRVRIAYWVDFALSLPTDKEFIIPCKNSADRINSIQRVENYIQEMMCLFPNSLYSKLSVYGTVEKGMHYLVFQKKKDPQNIAYVRNCITKEKTLAILLCSKYTRIGQIGEMLKDGISAQEIRQALGKEISKKEEEFLQNF